MILWFKPERLPLPVITIQGGHRNALGWFAWSRWESRDGAIIDEINFVPECLNRDILFDIAETLVHELVHLANYTAGIKDCSSNQYHNAHFQNRAVAVGMACERRREIGWAKTGLTPALRQRISALRPIRMPSTSSGYHQPHDLGTPPTPESRMAAGSVSKPRERSSANGAALASAPPRGWRRRRSCTPNA